MVVGGFGCSSRSLTDAGPLRTIDASTRPIDASSRPADAARAGDASHPVDASPRASDAGLDTRLACDCQLGGDGVMHMSWSCFEAYVGTRNVLQFCGAPGALTSACGLVDYTFYDENGLLQEYVYDESSGEQVGGHYATNIPYYAYKCPDQTISALMVESGIFPASSCTTRTACGCTADGRSLACPPPDAGASPWDAGACDCRIDSDGVLRMSWDCFSPGFVSGSPESGWCGAPGQWTRGCGLDVFTWDRLGLMQIDVYDQTGTEVGTQIQDPGANFFQCPTDPTLKSATVASGMFPAASCATTVCPCDLNPSGGIIGTFTCPTPDGGAHRDAAGDR
jgi:hypothetical protein